MTAGYDVWMAAVNEAINLEVGVSADDLADQPYHDWYLVGMDYREAAAEALAYEGWLISDE